MGTNVSGGNMVDGLPLAFSLCLYASMLSLRLRVFLQSCRGQHRRVWVLENGAVFISFCLARVRAPDL